MLRKKRVGIAFSGGAARGLSHIGVLEVLQEIGVEPFAIAGTSMGSIVGAFLCSGVSLNEMRKYVKTMDWKSFLLFSDLALSRTGIINGRRVERELKKFLGEKTFSDCNINFCCVAVDLFTRRRAILTEGRLIDAVRSSISIPGFFAPVCLDGKLLVDGGLIEPLPTEAVKIFDVDFIIASSINFKNDINKYQYLREDQYYRPEKEIYNYHNVGTGDHKRFNNLTKLFKNKLKKNNEKTVSVQSILDTSLNIMQRELSRKYAGIADMVIEPEVGDFGFFDLSHGNEIIERGRIAAEAKADEIRKKLGI